MRLTPGKAQSVADSAFGAASGLQRFLTRGSGHGTGRLPQSRLCGPWRRTVGTSVAFATLVAASGTPVASAPQSLTVVHVRSIGGGPWPGHFNAPRGIAIDRAGRVFVADAATAASRYSTRTAASCTCGARAGPRPGSSCHRGIWHSMRQDRCTSPMPATIGFRCSPPTAYSFGPGGRKVRRRVNSRNQAELRSTATATSSFRTRTTVCRCSRARVRSFAPGVRAAKVMDSSRRFATPGHPVPAELR